MEKALVFCEFNDAGGTLSLKRTSIELLSICKKNSIPASVVILGEKSSSLVEECSKFGAEAAFVSNKADFAKYNPELFSRAVCAALEQNKPTLVMAAGSSLGRDLFPRVAARLGAEIHSDVVAVAPDANSLRIKRPVYSGKCIATSSLSATKMKVLVFRANQFELVAPGAGKQITPIELNFASDNLASVIKEVVQGTSKKLELSEANTIVSGGRGLKEAQNFKLVTDLADVLGAAVGASRAIVDAGWVSHDLQVGQTGKTVAPSLYVAVGISGAIQHLAGMSSSKVIVAINNDANAPIFQKATYGIVGDLFTVVPKLTEEFKRALQK